MTTEHIRRSDVEVALLHQKVDLLSHTVTSHMEREEEDRKEIWTELKSLDRKLIFFSTLILASGLVPIDLMGLFF